MKPFHDVLGFCLGHWRRRTGLFIAIALLMSAATMTDVLVPLFAGRLIDAVSSVADGRSVARTAALSALGAMLALGSGMLVLRHLAFLGIIRFNAHIMQAIAQESFWRVQRFSTDWHANSFAGSVVRKITRGMWAFDLLTDTLLIALLPSCVVLLGTSLLLGWNWPVMGALVGCGAVVYLTVVLAGSMAYVAPAAQLSASWDTRVGGVLADAVGCNAVVKAFGAEAREDAVLAGMLQRWRERTQRHWVRGTNNSTAQLIMLLMLRGAVVGAALLLWWWDRATPGDVAYMLTSYFVVHGYLRDVGYHIGNVQRTVSDMTELVRLHGEKLGVTDAPGAKPIHITRGTIVFEHVEFRYGGHPSPLYQDFSLVIGAGERVGLVGHSGSGKTTCVKLIQRLYDVTGGRVLIDGQDIASITQASLRERIAIVQQEPILFHRSLAENIAYARPDAGMEAVERAARLANAHDFIMRLPRGYATPVGERGVKLSGGERQRIALARAFLADAPILILDEATSSLDTESERLIQQAMQRLMAGRTAIVIAHRLSTVRALDRILVFERGRIVEAGNHASLLRHQHGIYRRLFEGQALGLTEELVES